MVSIKENVLSFIPFIFLSRLVFSCRDNGKQIRPNYNYAGPDSYFMLYARKLITSEPLCNIAHLQYCT
jgi:hypothetical protein